MVRFRLIHLLAVVAVAASVGSYLADSAAEEVTPIPTQTVGDKVRGSMQAKLVHSQSILNGLVTRDFDSVGAAAKAMKRVSLAAPKHIEGDATDNELYNHFRLEFLRIATLMENMAAQENLEGAAFAYQSLTANCLACHSYLDGSQD